MKLSAWFFDQCGTTIAQNNLLDPFRLLLRNGLTKNLEMEY